MFRTTDYPLLVLVVSFIVLSLSVWTGATLLRRLRQAGEWDYEDFGRVLAATLTLLGLIIAFSFSMAVSRYDQRKNYEEEEANAIATEYLRADLLPAADTIKVRALLKEYFDQRVLFYTTRNSEQLQRINVRTSQLQNQLWSAMLGPAAEPNPVIALVVSGMNDVLNSQGYTQAAWSNRIPVAAWALMGVIAIFCHLLVGFGARNAKPGAQLLFVLPLVFSVSLFLISDIDSPRGGVIRVQPENLLAAAESLRTQ